MLGRFNQKMGFESYWLSQLVIYIWIKPNWDNDIRIQIPIGLSDSICDLQLPKLSIFLIVFLVPLTCSNAWSIDTFSILSVVKSRAEESWKKCWGSCTVNNLELWCTMIWYHATNLSKCSYWMLNSIRPLPFS